MKSIKKAIAMTLVLVAMMACATSAFATGYDSDPVYYPGVGVTYEVWSTLYQDSPGMFRSSVWITTNNQTRVPANSMFAKAELFSIDGETLYETEWTTNSTTDYWLYAITPTYNNYRSYYLYSRGQVKLYNGHENKQYNAPESPIKGGPRAAAMNLVATLDSTGNYPKTGSGETYGSSLLSEIVGCEPDLILAKNAAGITGYIKNAQLNPELGTDEDYENYIATLDANEWKVPMYDLNGNVVGEFEVQKSEIIVSDAESPDVVREALEKGTQAQDSRFEEARAYYEGNSFTAYSVSEDIPFTTVREYQVKKWLDNGDYKKTADGKTYGPATLVDIVGKMPDLVAVQGDNGESGFAKLEDYDLSFSSNDSAKAIEYFQQQVATGERTIPVYDLAGNIVDEFTFHKSERLFG